MVDYWCMSVRLGASQGDICSRKSKSTSLKAVDLWEYCVKVPLHHNNILFSTFNILFYLSTSKHII